MHNSAVGLHHQEHWTQDVEVVGRSCQHRKPAWQCVCSLAPQQHEIEGGTGVHRVKLGVCCGAARHALGELCGSLAIPASTAGSVVRPGEVLSAQQRSWTGSGQAEHSLEREPQGIQVKRGLT